MSFRTDLRRALGLEPRRAFYSVRQALADVLIYGRKPGAGQRSLFDDDDEPAKPSNDR